MIDANDENVVLRRCAGSLFKVGESNYLVGTKYKHLPKSPLDFQMSVRVYFQATKVPSKSLFCCQALVAVVGSLPPGGSHLSLGKHCW